jgi:hypothetical protein
MAGTGTISEPDLELFTVTDDVDVAVAEIQQAWADREEGDTGGGMRALPRDTGPVDD